MVVVRPSQHQTNLTEEKTKTNHRMIVKLIAESSRTFEAPPLIMTHNNI